MDILQGRFLKAGELAIRAANAWHSTVTEAELITPRGLLIIPARLKRLDESWAVIERWPAHRTIAPDRGTWLVAGVLSRIHARLQGYGPADRRRVLNDALIFATARKHGTAILTRDIDDFDFLQHLYSSGKLIFCERH